ncbi:MAG: hypothetical protein JXR48_11325 [Candidatus Delongbacteria bacterium]|nr:hypothetical protein [Candidatus Delongbacteria bacterium]MBN2835544.1 hypothetical protein [Candidatus Delongbacteria bacterium]
MKSALILYPFVDDPQSVILYEELINRGFHVHYLPFSISDGNIIDNSFTITNKKIIYKGEDITNVAAVFIRALTFSVPSNIPALISETEYAHWRVKYIDERNRFNTIFSMLTILQNRGALILNHPETYFHHNTKSQFFSYLYKNGFNTPPFISTNRIDDIEILKERELIAKSTYGVGATRNVNLEEIDKYELLKTPAMFQEKVDGYTVRVHTVGTKIVLSLKILSDSIDSRTDATGFEVIKLDEKIEREIIDINRLFNIYYSAWDIVIDNNENYYLLDCNTGPYIYWIGKYFTRVVMRSLSELILGYYEHKDLELASQVIEHHKLDFSKVFKNKEFGHLSKEDSILRLHL